MDQEKPAPRKQAQVESFVTSLEGRYGSEQWEEIKGILTYSSYLSHLDLDFSELRELSVQDLKERENKKAKEVFEDISEHIYNESEDGDNNVNLEDFRAQTRGELLEIIKSNGEDYYKFIKDNFDPEDVEFFEENIRKYEDKFADKVRKLKKARRESEKDCDLQEFNFLGAGGNGSVYEMELDNGQKFAVKFDDCLGKWDKFGEVDRASIYTTIESMRKATENEIDNVPHLQAFSFQDGVYIMDVMEGNEVQQDEIRTPLEEGEDSIHPKDSDIPASHIVDLIKTIIELDKNGLTADSSSPENFFYKPGEGFKVIEYSKKRTAATRLQKIENILVTIKAIYGFFDDEGRPRPSDDSELEVSTSDIEEYAASRIVEALEEQENLKQWAQKLTAKDSFPID